MISTEWVQTIATAIPVYAGAGLLVWGQGYRWRRVLWEEHASDLRRLEAELRGPLRATWSGWRVRGARGSFRISGGLRGVRARWLIADRKGWCEGMPPVQPLLDEISQTDR